MNNSCRSLCGYYDAKSEHRNQQNKIFRKYCYVCDLELVSRYSICPCCHDPLRGARK